MAFTKDDYGKYKVIKAFNAIRETQRDATDMLIPESSILDALASLNKTDAEWVRFKWEDATYRTMESVFRANTKKI